MWMYKHWRYLPGSEQDPKYPVYANPSKPFRELLAQFLPRCDHEREAVGPPLLDPRRHPLGTCMVGDCTVDEPTC